MTATPMQAAHDAPPIVRNVIERLDDVTARPSGRAWRAACPVPHPVGADGALLITLARDGRVMVECQAGCTTADILDHLGLKTADLFPATAENEEYFGESPTGAHATDAPAEQLPQAIRAIDAPPPQPIQWIVDDLFTAGEIGLLVGDGGSFKSTAAINMAAALADGSSVWNRFNARPRSSLIISAEDSMDVVLMRLNAFVAGHNYDAKRVLSNVHLFATTDVTISSAQWQDHITAEAKRIDAGLIVLDPFAELISGDENSNTEVRPIVKFLRALGRNTGAAVVVVHHAGKQGQDRRALDRIRGASALPSAARSILFFDYQQNGAGVAVQHLKMSRTPRLENFILARNVEHAADNRALWYSATLSHTEVRAVNAERAETFVLTQVTAAPREHTTSDLRKLARKDGISIEELGRALNVLQESGKIHFEPGPRGARKWFAAGFANPELDLVKRS